MPKGFTYSQWKWFMECQYTFMPDWYWNEAERMAEYQRYTEES
tara:strand:- start:213 stop:341 length:129 start_codon:yes stop_codon:yes gene_type:complete